MTNFGYACINMALHEKAVLKYRTQFLNKNEEIIS